MGSPTGRPVDEAVGPRDEALEPYGMLCGDPCEEPSGEPREKPYVAPHGRGLGALWTRLVSPTGSPIMDKAWGACGRGIGVIWHALWRAYGGGGFWVVAHGAL